MVEWLILEFTWKMSKVTIQHIGMSESKMMGNVSEKQRWGNFQSSKSSGVKQLKKWKQQQEMTVVELKWNSKPNIYDYDCTRRNKIIEEIKGKWMCSSLCSSQIRKCRWTIRNKKYWMNIRIINLSVFYVLSQYIKQESIICIKPKHHSGNNNYKQKWTLAAHNNFCESGEHYQQQNITSAWCLEVSTGAA